MSWSCRHDDETHSLSGFGLVVETWLIDAEGTIAKSRADGLGRTLASLDADGKSHSMEYDASGNVTKQLDPNGVGAELEYDSLGRLTSTTDTATDTTAMAYNLAGNTISQTDAKSATTEFEFDARGRQVKSTDRLEGTTNFTYGAGGHLLSPNDAESQMTEYQYNARGEKTRETYPGHVAMTNPGDSGYGIIDFLYDPAGQLLRKTDQLGDTVATEDGGAAFSRSATIPSRSDTVLLQTSSYKDCGELFHAIDPAEKRIARSSTPPSGRPSGSKTEYLYGTTPADSANASTQ